MAAERRRLDTWLWYARFAKTRTLAARLVQEGRIRVNGQRATVAAKPVGPGDVLTIAAPHRTALIRIVSTGERRGPAPEAQGLYQEIG